MPKFSGYCRGASNAKMRSQLPVQKRRTQKGNMLVLTTAITFLVVVPLAGLALHTVQAINVDAVRQSAADAASLTAANDLSRIVISTPCGFVSLSDSAPNGKATLAKDGFAVSAKSINSLLATARLDLIIADATHEANLLQLADQDYNKAILAKKALFEKLREAIKSGAAAEARDANGVVVDPKADALKAYLANIGAAAAHPPKYFKLELGMIKGGSNTTTQVPTPSRYAFADTDQQSNGNYRAFVSIPCKTSNRHYDFVFAGGGDTVQLVNEKFFETTDPSLPYAMPSIVKVEVEQVMGNRGKERLIVASCAQPFSTTDPNHFPGALTVSFPDGRSDFEQAFPSPGSIASGPKSSLPLPLFQSIGGDYPGAGKLSTLASAQTLGSPTIGTSWSIMLYDWIKRAGPRANVQAVIDMLITPFPKASAADAASRHVYTWTVDGAIQDSLFASEYNPQMTVGDDQIFGAAAIDLDNLGSQHNGEALIHDQCFRPEGAHVGEPIPVSLLQIRPLVTVQFPASKTNQADAPTTPSAPLLAFPVSDGVEIVRSTYLKNGVCADITFRTKPNS